MGELGFLFRIEGGGDVRRGGRLVRRVDTDEDLGELGFLFRIEGGGDVRRGGRLVRRVDTDLLSLSCRLERGLISWLL